MTAPSLRLVFWETTTACNLTCRHGRAVPQRALGPTELKTSEAFDLIDAIAQVARPVMVLSGGEPCSVRTCSKSRNTVSPPGFGWRWRRTVRWPTSGLRQKSPTPESRGSQSAWTLRTPTPTTASAGCRGRTGATCAPHYYRIRAQRIEEKRSRGDLSSTFIAPGTRAKAAPSMMSGGQHGQHLSATTRGCLAGTNVCFVSNEGRVYPCGYYLPVSAGDTRTQRFADIWNRSAVFEQRRNPEVYERRAVRSSHPLEVHRVHSA